MGAGRANLRRFGTHHDMSAVPALPNLFEDLLGLHILQQGAITLLVVLFNSGNQAEFRSQFRKALFFGGLSKSGVHIGPFVVLPAGSSGQVLGGTADPLQLLEPHLGVFFLVISRLQEQGRNLLKALFFGLGRKIGILVPRLRFTGKGRFQIFVPAYLDISFSSSLFLIENGLKSIF